MKKVFVALVALAGWLSAHGQTTVAVPDTLDFASVESFLAKNLQARVATAADGNVVVKFEKAIFYNIRESDNGTHDANSVLREVGRFMQRFKDSRIHAVGYADRGTGNYQLNQMYAGRRAAQFCDDLVRRYHVQRSRITSESMGDVVQPFSDNDRNRCVIVHGTGYLYVAPPAPQGPSEAELLADSLRRMWQLEKERRYAAEQQRHAKEPVRPDTIIITRVDTISHVDTLYVQPADTLKPERPFGLNKQNRWNNWFITLGVGPGIFQGDHNVDAPWKDRIYPAFDLSMGKWIYPALGVRAGVNLDMVHSYYNANPSNPNPLAYKDGQLWYGEFVHGASPNEPHAECPWLYRMDYRSWNFHADVMMNFSSFMWSPYTRRIWNLIGYAGVGCIANWDSGDHDWFNYATSLNVGLMNSFRINEHFDINLDLRLKRFSDDYNCFRQGRGGDGMVNLYIGGTWHFIRRGF